MFHNASAQVVSDMSDMKRIMHFTQCYSEYSNYEADTVDRILNHMRFVSVSCRVFTHVTSFHRDLMSCHSDITSLS